MVNKIFSATFVLALLLTQAAHALPQASPSDVTPPPLTSSVASTSPESSVPPPSSSVSPPSSSVSPPSPSVSPPSSSVSPPSSSVPPPNSSSISPSILSSPSAPPASPTESTPTAPPSAPPTAPQPNVSQPSVPTPSPLEATWDSTFDNPNGSMDSVACSNGDNGLDANFTTFGSLPSFPFIGGAFDIVWDSPNCGSCWNVTYPATGVSIQFTAIDTSGVGFNLAQEAFANLTNGNTNIGVIDVIANKISTTPCPKPSS